MGRAPPRPTPASADARVVVLRNPGARIPHALPGWLHVQCAAARARVRLGLREQPPAYDGRSTPGDDDHDADDADDLDAARLADALWAASPHHAPTVGTVEDYLLAAATALTYPAPAPADHARRLHLARDHARHRGGLLAPLLDLASSDLARRDLDQLALERWLHRRFRTPDDLAAELLIERIDAGGDPETAALLRFLRAAEIARVADGTGGTGVASEHLELALDRRALLEQAPPWRYFESGGFAAALAAVRPWARRYRTAYDAHYRAVAARAVTLRRTIALDADAAETLRRLDAIPALGDPVGVVPLHAFAAARHDLDALPAEPDHAQARTADVTLGADPRVFADAARAVEAVRAALEVQRRRLATRAAHLVLDRAEVPALDRLLQVLAAGDLDSLERVLDDRLADHIESLLVAAGGTDAGAGAA